MIYFKNRPSSDNLFYQQQHIIRAKVPFLINHFLQTFRFVSKFLCGLLTFLRNVYIPFYNAGNLFETLDCCLNDFCIITNHVCNSMTLLFAFSISSTTWVKSSTAISVIFFPFSTARIESVMRSLVSFATWELLVASSPTSVG